MCTKGTNITSLNYSNYRYSPDIVRNNLNRTSSVSSQNNIPMVSTTHQSINNSYVVSPNIHNSHNSQNSQNSQTGVYKSFPHMITNQSNSKELEIDETINKEVV